MAAQDVALREEFERLRRQFNALASTVAALIVITGNSNIYVAADFAEVATANLAAYNILLVKSDPNGDFGMFLYTASGTANGITIIADANGKLFQLYVP